MGCCTAARRPSRATRSTSRPRMYEYIGLLLSAISAMASLRAETAQACWFTQAACNTHSNCVACRVRSSKCTSKAAARQTSRLQSIHRPRLY